MYIAERIVGVTTYTLLLLIICWLIRYQKKIYTNVILKLYTVCLCLLAYFFVPDTTFDLYRLRIAISYWTDLSFFDVVRYALKDSTPTWVLYSYFINKLGDPDLLQTITCAITFSLIFSILYKAVKRWNMYRCDVAIMLFVIMSNGTIFIQTLSGIRTMLSFSIIFWCIYQELFEDETLFQHIILYVFAGFMHSAALVLVAGRIAFLAFQSGSKRKVISNYLICGFSLGAFIFMAIRLVVSSANKAMSYLNNPDEYFYFWQFSVSLIGVIVTLYILSKSRQCTLPMSSKANLIKGGMKDFLALKNCRSICFVVQAISLVAAPFSYAVFTRFSVFSAFLSIPLFASVSKIESEKSLMRPILKGVALLMLVLSCVRGDLCGYKFFVLS